MVAFSGTVAAPTDSKSNTWVRAAFTVSSNVTSYIYYACASTGAFATDVAHTFSDNPAAGNYPSVYVQAWSGSHSSPLDQAICSALSTAVTSVQAGSITPTQDGELIFALFGLDGVISSAAIDSGFTETDFNASNAGAFGGSNAYLIQGTAAAVNPTWTWASATHAQATIASFFVGAASSITTKYHWNLQVRA